MRLLCGYHYTLYTLLIIIINIFISIIVVFQRLRKYLFCNAFNKKQRLEAQNMTSWELIFLSVRKNATIPNTHYFMDLETDSDDWGDEDILYFIQSLLSLAYDLLEWKLPPTFLYTWAPITTLIRVRVLRSDGHQVEKGPAAWCAENPEKPCYYGSTPFTNNASFSYTVS